MLHEFATSLLHHFDVAIVILALCSLIFYMNASCSNFIYNVAGMYNKCCMNIPSLPCPI